MGLMFRLATWMTEYPDGAHLIRCAHDDVRPWTAAATREGVSMAKTKSTEWFCHHLGPDVAFCAIWRGASKWRLKGDYVHPEWRGMKLYRVLLLHRIAYLISRGGGTLEILTRDPAHLGRWGFEHRASLRHGVTRMDMQLPATMPQGMPLILIS